MTAYTRNLITENYGVVASSKPNTFLVIKPVGEVYETNPILKSCSCAAGQNGRPCCHLAQLQDLLRHETRRMLKLSAETPLLSHELQLVDEVEALVAKWKEVLKTREARLVQTKRLVNPDMFRHQPESGTLAGRHAFALIDTRPLRTCLLAVRWNWPGRAGRKPLPKP